METIIVKVVKKPIKAHWYKLNEEHEVCNRIAFWADKPHYEKGNGTLGIPIENCEVIRNPNKIRLNNNYMAEIKDGIVKVDCAEFTFDAIKKLYKAIKKQST